MDLLTEQPAATPTAEPTEQPTSEPTQPPKEGITIIIGGKQIAAEEKLITVNDRVLVPMRVIFEELGAEVAWENETRTVTATRDGDTVVLRIGEEWFTKNGSIMGMDVPSMIYHDWTYVPLWAVSEALERTVNWDDVTKTVTIN